MFKHILIPTDGSPLAMKGVKAGVRLAKALGARVTGVYVVPPYIPPITPEAGMYMPATAIGDYDKAARMHGEKALAALERVAQAAGVRCATEVVTRAQPWEGILKAARRARCDAVVIASHGRGGLRGLILGSQTSRVLAHSTLPVLVIR
jgi:nucleotide-binding universal stress UspA family protein